MNSLQKIAGYGQAVWLDDMHRDLMTGGTLQRLLAEDDLRGMTSNPPIFQKAIAQRADYEEQIDRLKSQEMRAEEILSALAVTDVRMAADILRPLYDRTNGDHGYVSIEVNPYFAHYSRPTIEEARRLWWAVARPNVFIKIPATPEGLIAIEQLLGEGININVTLLFGLRRYGEVARAFMAGLGRRLGSGESVEKLRSVASFFLSRIDALIDPELEQLMRRGGKPGQSAELMHGQVAISLAKVAYQMSKKIFAGDRWARLAEKGGRPQQLLWASTSTKNSHDSDVKYVDALIGDSTITTMPLKTLQAYRDHGDPNARLENEIERAQQILAQLPKLGISLDDMTGRLEEEGLDKFCRPYDETLELLQEEIAAV